MAAKGEEGKMEVIASCESYPLPRSRPSLFPPFPNPPSLAAWRAAVNMGVTGRGAPGNWGDWGTRERESGGRSAVAGSARQEQQGLERARGKKEKAWDSVVQQGQLDWMWSELPVSTAATGGTPRLTTCIVVSFLAFSFCLSSLSRVSPLWSTLHVTHHHG